MATPKEQLKERMLFFLEYLKFDGGSGLSGSMPKFDYYALDFLDFAEMNLRRTAELSEKSHKENELISCVSNLKRALDCQIECFLSFWGLRDEVNKRNLGLITKLKFLADIGIVSSRTIQRFTTIRNKIEHEFKRPHIADLEALFDLVTAVVAILQMTTGFNYSIDFTFESKDHDGWLTVLYDEENLKCIAKWHFRTKPEQNSIIEASFDSINDFAYFFRVLLLLNQFDSFASYDHIRTRLNA